jgi:NADH:ubiquinone reductase (non-electrogenic)
MSQIPAQKNSRRGLEVNEYLVVNGTENIWAVGDCAIANYAPTAQVAAQEGAFLARLFNTMAKTDEINAELKELSDKQSKAKADDRNALLGEISERQKQLRRIKQVGPFQYSHQGSMAYIGAEKAVADVSWFSGNIASGGTMTYLFWKSAYLSMCFSSKFFSPPSIIIFRLKILADFLSPSTARNRVLVVVDWLKSKFFGRDVSRE